LKKFIVDASVVTKWFMTEVHTDAACRLLNRNYELAAPGLIFAEFGNVVWKKCRRKEITLELAKGLIKDFRKFPLTIYDIEPLFESAWAIAKQYERSFYDSLYLSLAKKQKSQMVTADLKFYNALNKQSIAKFLLWVEDIPTSIH
jgi:predicted nucleic acid-binding protein